MADLYSQVIRGDGVSTYTVGANSRKFGNQTFQFGTRNISPLVIYSDAGDFANDQDSNSNFYKVMSVVQSRCEIFGIGNVTNTYATLFVADDTLYADEGNSRAPNDSSDIDLLQDEISAATGLDISVYNGIVTGDDISYDD
jgi:hypothetical protein